MWYSLLSVKVFCKCIFSSLYLPAEFTDRPIHHLAVFGLSFLSCFLHPAAQCFVCLGRVVCAVLPSSFSSLPSPLLPSSNIFGLQLVCFCATPWVQVAETKIVIPLWLPIFPARTPVHDKDGPPSRLNWNADRMSSFCVCSSPPPAAHQHHADIHTPHVHMQVSSQADTFTLGGLLASFSHFFVCCLLPLRLLSACTEPQFCLSACYQSLSLSPFTFLPCSDVSPVFHFIHASCSSLINNQMTSPVSFFSCFWMSNDLHLWTFSNKQPSVPCLFSGSFAAQPQVWIGLVIWMRQHSNINISVSLCHPEACCLQEEMVLFPNQLLLSILYAESIGLCAQSPHVHVLCQTVWIKMCFVIPHTVAFWWSVPFCFINPPTQAR